MGIVRLNAQCISCISEKHLHKYPPTATEAQSRVYMQKMLRILADAKASESAPEVVAKLVVLQKEMFGIENEFAKIKAYYNDLILKKAPKLRENIARAVSPLHMALGYAMLGNYIDFGALDSVEEDKLEEMLADAKNIRFDAAEYAHLERDLAAAKRLVYLTDNCGEIVFDRLLIELLQTQYPDLHIEVIVRGAPALNDATMEDAKQIGLDKIVSVQGNGTAIMGTCLDRITDSAVKAIENADIILAKGQGNFETLRHVGKNIYYLFMCKCPMFAERFGVERFSPMLLNDLRMKVI